MTTEPRGPKPSHRTARLTVMFEPGEVDAIFQAALARGLSGSAFVRTLVLDHIRPKDAPPGTKGY